MAGKTDRTCSFTGASSSQTGSGTNAVVQKMKTKESSCRVLKIPCNGSTSYGMGRWCCVPGCTSNYDSSPGYVTVSEHPTVVEKKRTGLRSIPRAIGEPSQSSAV